MAARSGIVILTKRFRAGNFVCHPEQAFFALHSPCVGFASLSNCTTMKKRRAREAARLVRLYCKLRTLIRSQIVVAVGALYDLDLLFADLHCGSRHARAKLSRDDHATHVSTLFSGGRFVVGCDSEGGSRTVFLLVVRANEPHAF